MARRNFMGCATVGLIATIPLLTIAPHCSRDIYRIKVIDTERIVESDGESTSSKYLVFTELSDGTERVFENTDSLYELKWNSSDVQARLKKVQGTDQLADVRAYGWRIPFLSWYENIVGVDLVPQTDG